MKNKGFTLVELLVVIVIIGILATISIGTFQGYFAQARDAVRTSTVKSITTIIKTSRATSEQQYAFADINELTTTLTAAGITMPTESGDACYIYGHTINRPSDFFVAARLENNEDSQNIIDGTPNGINAAQIILSSFGGSLDDCSSIPDIANLNIIKIF